MCERAWPAELDDAELREELAVAAQIAAQRAQLLLGEGPPAAATRHGTPRDHAYSRLLLVSRGKSLTLSPHPALTFNGRMSNGGQSHSQDAGTDSPSFSSLAQLVVNDALLRG
jgi:hypothetical protein